MFPGDKNLVEMKSTQFQVSNIYEQHINYTVFFQPYETSALIQLSFVPYKTKTIDLRQNFD